MILEELRLRNWRSYRSSRTFRFAEGINLLVGPNEAGKSTVFEALARLLLDRHTSAARELHRARPLGSSLGPEVQGVFRTGGVRYRAVKRFLQDPIAELWVEREGRFELDHEGDRADAELRALTGGGAVRGVSRPEQRGLAQALWYLQRDEALPARAWSQVVHEGLSGLMKASLSSPEQDAVLEALQREFEQVFTRTGRVKKNSELRLLETEIPRLEESLAERRAELERTEEHRLVLAQLAEQAARLAARRSELETELARLDATLAGGDEVRAQHARALEAVRQSEREAARLNELLERTKRLKERAEEAGEELERARAEEKTLQASARKHRREAEAHARRWEEELLPRARALRDQIEDLRARLRIDQLERELERIEARGRRRRAIEAERSRLVERLAALDAPTAEEWQEVERLEDRRRTLGDRVRQAAVRVQVELEGEHRLEIDPEPARDPGSSEYLVGRATTFRIPGAASLRVRSVDRALERWEEEAASAERAIAERLGAYGVASLDELAARRDERRVLEVRLEELRARLAEVEAGGGKGDGESSLASEIVAELEELRGRAPQGVLPGIEGWAQDRTASQMRQLEREVAEVERSIRSEREAEQGADSSYRQQHEAAGLLSERRAVLEASVSALEERLADELTPFGDRSGLEKAARAAAAVVAERRQELQRAAALLRERIEVPQTRRAEVERELREIDERRSAVAVERSDRLARLEEAAAADLQSQVDDLEGRLGVAQRRLEVLQKRAEAIALLRRLADHHLDRRARRLVEPVAGLVDRWVVELTGKRYAGLALDERLVPTDIRVARYDEPLPLDSLSYGTYEQVVVLLRLALGVLLSAEERQLVILDDRLVNADAERLQRLLAILEEVGRSCQLVIASCRPSPFLRLANRVLELEGDADREAGSELRARSTERVGVPLEPKRPDQERD